MTPGVVTGRRPFWGLSSLQRLVASTGSSCRHKQQGEKRGPGRNRTTILIFRSWTGRNRSMWPDREVTRGGDVSLVFAGKLQRGTLKDRACRFRQNVK